MKIFLLIFAIIFCLAACSSEHIRVVQMENGVYEVQERPRGFIFRAEWRPYYEAEKCYRFKTKEEACAARDHIMELFTAWQTSLTVKKVIQCK